MAEPDHKTAEYIELRSAEEKADLVCRYVERAYERGETVAVYAPDAEEAAELDRRLWTFRQQSFIPHVVLSEAEAPLIEPVVIFGDAPGETESDVLILAGADGMPEWFQRFGHVYDFAPTYDDDLREAARERYAACQEAGYKMRFIRP
ncbi:MAG: DNA polymerase III subunit chi [Candidatus Brocadiia bacterium]